MTDDTPLATDMLSDITAWVEYMLTELEEERIDLVDLGEIEQVFEIIKEQE